MAVADQETWLVKKLQDLYVVENQLKKLLGAVRGGQRVTIPEIERPDEALLKED